MNFCPIVSDSYVCYLSQEKLGSMLDKSMRVEKMVRSLGLAMGLDESSIATAQEAAPLASADLATAMVMEFTNLAGIMGRHYASKEGYSSAVSCFDLGLLAPFKSKVSEAKFLAL